MDSNRTHHYMILGVKRCETMKEVHEVLHLTSRGAFKQLLEEGTVKKINNNLESQGLKQVAYESK